MRAEIAEVIVGYTKGRVYFFIFFLILLNILQTIDVREVHLLYPVVLTTS
ncbi:hypothetical protein APHNP_0460 [Anaplasma phagocytophilum str. ApNP]|uniref:Uncharacterized protein n=1 Tax=Anaplasma phagocytophilum str. ApNP TaxID=1359153 RepID=A0A0F3NFA3_ANAPH|nr:hypothetical protein APHNP_0460 [Anaplasma phagocytophilum str. ApNP]